MHTTARPSETKPVHLHLGRRFGDVLPSPEADEELTWFFNEALCAIERPSEQGRLLSGDRRSDVEQLEARVEALRAARKIWRRMQQIGMRDAHVLRALYTLRFRPGLLGLHFGHLVGVVETLPCFEDGPVVAGSHNVAVWKEQAVRACSRALSAYQRARGKSPSVVPQEDR